MQGRDEQTIKHLFFVNVVIYIYIYITKREYNANFITNESLSNSDIRRLARSEYLNITF